MSLREIFTKCKISLPSSNPVIDRVLYGINFDDICETKKVELRPLVTDFKREQSMSLIRPQNNFSSTWFEDVLDDEYRKFLTKNLLTKTGPDAIMKHNGWIKEWNEYKPMITQIPTGDTTI